MTMDEAIQFAEWIRELQELRNTLGISKATLSANIIGVTLAKS